MVHVGLLLAFAAALTAQVALLSKHRGAVAAPTVDIRHPLRSAVGLFRSKWFAIGFGIAVVSWGFQVVAMSMAPLSLVKAVLAGSLALLAIPATLWFGHRLGRREFIGLGLSAIGLALLAVTMHNAAEHAHTGYSVPTLAVFEGAAIAVGAVLLFGGRRRSCPTQGGLMLGASAGLLVGVADISVKALTGTVPADPMSLLGPWTLVAIAGAVGGFFALGRGLQVGGAIQVIAISTMTANVSAVLGGIFVFGDPMGSDALGIAAKVTAFAAVIGAAALMPGPQPQQQAAPARA